MDINGVDLAALDGLAKQRVHHEHAVFEIPHRVGRGGSRLLGRRGHDHFSFSPSTNWNYADQHTFLSVPAAVDPYLLPPAYSPQLISSTVREGSTIESSYCTVH